MCAHAAWNGCDADDILVDSRLDSVHADYQLAIDNWYIFPAVSKHFSHLLGFNIFYL